MAHSFTNSKFLKVFLADVIDAMPYLKDSKSHFASEMKGKKAGKSYYFSLNDAGHPQEGLAIDRSGADSGKGEVNEKQVKMTLSNMHSFVDLNVLDSITELVDFETEIGQTYGIRLGAEYQKKTIEKTIWDASVAFVNDSNPWKALSAASSHMKGVRAGSKVVGYLDPVAEGSLTVDAINGFHFGPSERGSKFYADASIGKFQGAEYVYCNDIPMVTGATRSLTISSVTETDGETTVTLSASASLKAGEALYLTVSGKTAYACNGVGMPTNNKFALIVKANTSSSTTFKCSRICVEDCGSRNCFIEGVTALTGLAGGTLTNVLTDGKKYFVAQVRTADVMNWDNVDIDDLIGAENKSVSVGGVKLKVTIYSDGDAMQNTTRWDICAGNCIVDNRYAGLAYLPEEVTKETVTVDGQVEVVNPTGEKLDVTTHAST